MDSSRFRADGRKRHQRNGKFQQRTYFSMPDKEYYQKNRDRIRESQAKYYREHREHILDLKKAEYARHSDKYKERARKSGMKRYLENRDRYLASQRDSKYRAKMRIIELFGGKCVRCGFTDERALQIDHIDANPAPKSTGLRGGEKLYRAILKGIVPFIDFQLLCANCNIIKRFENGEGCHKRNAPHGIGLLIDKRRKVFKYETV